MFVHGNMLIEYAIRIGTDDIIKDLSLIDQLIPDCKRLLEGREVAGEHIPTIMDKFQKRLNEIPKKGDENDAKEMFRTTVPSPERIKAYLTQQSQESNVSIKHAYPRDSQDLPCISIISDNENESPFVGNTGGYVYETDGAQRERHSANNSVDYSVMILTTNFDETFIWYLVIKYALMRYRQELEAYGMRNIALSWQSPQPAQEYLQSGIFVYEKTCIVSCEKTDEFDIGGGGFNSVDLQNINVDNNPIYSE